MQTQCINFLLQHNKTDSKLYEIRKNIFKIKNQNKKLLYLYPKSGNYVAIYDIKSYVKYSFN